MVGSGLTQCDVASRLGVMSGNTPDLNLPENLRGILQQELKSEEPSTSVQQLNERLESACVNIVRYAGGYGVEHAESGGKVHGTIWRTHRYAMKEK